MASNESLNNQVAPSVVPFDAFDAKTDADGSLAMTADPENIDEEAIISVLNTQIYWQRESLNLSYNKLYNKASVTYIDEFDPVPDIKSFLKATADPENIDVEAIISILTNRSYRQRQSIAQLYRWNYKHDLIDMLSNHLYGHLELLVEALLTEPVAFLAKELHRALCGPNPDNTALIEILGTIYPNKRKDLKTHYKDIFKNNLGEDFRIVTDEDFWQLLNSLMTEKRSASLDAYKAVEVVKELTAGNYDEWIQIFTDAMGAQLSLIIDEYYEHTQKNIEKEIKFKFDGNLRMGLLALVKIAEDVTEYFAEELMKASQGPTPDEHKIMRIAVSRSEIDSKRIKEKFELMYKIPLRQLIEDCTTGHHTTALISLLKL